MSIYTNNIYHRKIWESNLGPIPKDSDGRSYEIHHIDGNHFNNDINNLKCISIQEHYNIHYSQGDYKACLIMANRMKISPQEKSRLAVLSNTGSNNPSYGKYWWTDGESEIKAEIQPGPEWRRGRCFSEIHKQKFSKRSKKGENNPSFGIYWWTNGTDSVKSDICPDGWYRGQGSKPKTTNKGNTGKFWWTNGVKNKATMECPGPEWRRGRIFKS
jgi:hypothetical protein